jgi:cytochrome c
MTKLIAGLLGVSFLLALMLTGGQVAADPKRVTLPADYDPAKYVLYGVHNRPDNGQVRYLYANTIAAEGAKKDGELPHGSLLVMEVYKAKVDAAGAPVVGPGGIFEKGDLAFYGLMEKRPGWGNDIPENIRNGDWNYTTYSPEKVNRAETKEEPCLTCHKMIGTAGDYILSYDELVAKVRGAVPKVTASNEPAGPPNADRGKQLFTRCTNCHTADKTAKHKVGPNLGGVVGRETAKAAGFAYSPALQSKAGVWDEARLSDWLISPQAFASGTKMVFQGFPRAQDRADVIAFLKTLN